VRVRFCAAEVGWGGQPRARAKKIHQPSKDIIITFSVPRSTKVRPYQIAVKIKPLYLTNNTRYLTSNTTRVVQHNKFLY
jgi:hypothetical protein